MPNRVSEKAAMERLNSELAVVLDYFIFSRQLRLALPVDLCYRGDLSIEVGYYEASRLIPCYKKFLRSRLFL